MPDDRQTASSATDGPSRVAGLCRRGSWTPARRFEEVAVCKTVAPSLS